MRELDVATVADSAFYADRRESAENEAHDYRDALEAGAIGSDHIRGEIGEVLIGVGARPSVAGGAHGLPLARPRGRGPRRRRVRRPPGARARSRRRGGRSDPARGDPRRARDDRRDRRSHAARQASRAGVARRDLPQARDLQPIGSFKLRGAYNAARRADPELVARRAGHGERREHGPGRGLGGEGARGALHGGRSGLRARDEGLRDGAARRPRWSRSRSTSGGRRSRSRAGRRRRPLPPPGRERGGDGGERDDRARDPRGPSGPGRWFSSPSAAAASRPGSPARSRRSAPRRRSTAWSRRRRRR